MNLHFRVTSRWPAGSPEGSVSSNTPEEYIGNTLNWLENTERNLDVVCDRNTLMKRLEVKLMTCLESFNETLLGLFLVFRISGPLLVNMCQGCLAEAHLASV